MRKRFRQIVVFPYTDKVMEDRIKIVMNRLSMLERELSSANSHWDARGTLSLIKLNELMLNMLTNNLPIRFYKRPEVLGEILEPLSYSDS